MALSLEEKIRRFENDPAWKQVRLPIDQRSDRHEYVLVEALDPTRYRVAATPGFVLGIATDDVIELDPLVPSGFRILERGGNIGVHIFFDSLSGESVQKEAQSLFLSIGGWLDGTIADCGLCFTFPLSSGFRSIESAIEKLQAGRPDVEWGYANVYDSSDGVTPLNWWIQDSE